MSEEKKENTSNSYISHIHPESLIGIVKSVRAKSLFDDIREKKDDLINAIDKNLDDNSPLKKSINDSYGNTLTSVGTEDKVKSFTTYGMSNDTLNFPLWLALYNDSWVFRRAIDKPAQDEIRCGITLGGTEDKDEVYRLYKRHITDLIEILKWGALFGGSVGVMMFDNIKDEQYSQTLTRTQIEKSKSMRIYVTDRWYGVSQDNSNTVTDMNSIDFGKPKYYNITFADGKTLKVHHTFVLRYEHRTAPRLIKNGLLQGWGYAEGSHIINELARDDQLKADITSLINKALIEVIKMSGMRGVFMGADTENQQQLEKRLEMVNWGRNFNSLTFLDKDDEYQQNQFSGLSGLSDLLEKNMWLIAAALEMQGVLYGHLNNGLGEDNEALERYDETIQNRCEGLVRPVIEKLLNVLYIKCGIQEKVEFSFNSLLMKQHDKEKMEAIKSFQELLSGLLNDGIIEPKQYAEILQTYMTKGVIDFKFDDEAIKELEDRTLEQLENIDLNEEEQNVNNETKSQTI